VTPEGNRISEWDVPIRDIPIHSEGSIAGAGGVNSLGSRGVTEDVELPKELTPVTSHSIAFVEATLLRQGRHSIR